MLAVPTRPHHRSWRAVSVKTSPLTWTEARRDDSLERGTRAGQENMTYERRGTRRIGASPSRQARRLCSAACAPSRGAAVTRARRNDDSASIGGSSVIGDPVTPGKRALTESLPVLRSEGSAASDATAPPAQADTTSSVVQRKASGEPATTGEAPADIASRGVASPGGSLPHLDHLQRCFGRHDVSGVTAHQGPAASEATSALGAQAFAVGNAVAFGGAPDLHTAAHEAAHVVQQRGGVQLKGGLDGGADDPHERHADAVADAVVAGQSAESLLDQAAGGGAATAAVQRRSEPGALVSATDYLKLNDRAAGDAIMRHLLAITPPHPHPRLAWHNVGAFYQRFFKQLDRIIYVFDSPPDLAQLVHPQDPYAMIDSVRPLAGKQHGATVGPWDWQPSVGAALAEMIEEALVASLYRIGPRWLHIAELAGDVSGTSVLVDPDAVPRSHSMDRAIVPALCQPGVLEVLAAKQHTAKPTSSTRPLAQPAGVGLRPVHYVWLGKETHGELWNWVRATSPADATVEEVSAQLFSDTAESHGEKHGDYLAFAMTSAPPLFGLPGHWAIKFDEGKAYAPATVSATSDQTENNLVTLAGSSLADDQALREANIAPDSKDAKGAKPVAGASAAAGTLAQDALSQATYCKQTLASWHLDKAVDPTLTFLGRRMGELADTSKLPKWQPVLAGQKEMLSRIGAGIVEIDRAVATMGLSSKQGDDARPLRDILRLYADAAGASQLLQTSEALLQRAATLQATLPLRGVQSATRDLGASADMLRDSTPKGDHERDRLTGAASQIDEDSRKLQTSMMRGAKVDPAEIDRVTVNAGEIALKSKVHAIASQLEALENAANDAGDGFFAAIASLFSGDFRGLGFETQVMKDSLESITRDMDWQAQAASLGMHVENAKDLDDYNREMMRVRKAALGRAQGQFSAMAANDRIRNFLQKGATLVKWQSFRTSCVKLAVMIGVSIVGGAVGGMVARGVGGMMMTSGGVAAMEDLSMGAQVIARGSGMVAETAVTSVGQTAIFGDKLSDSFLENMLMSLGSAGILAAIGHQAETLAQIERASEGLWAKAGAAGKLVLKEGAAITGHTIMGAALGYVSHRLVTGKTQPPPETLEEWLLQGASIAVGRYVGKAMEARAANARKLAAIKGFAAGQKLLAATTALHEHALRAESRPQPKEAAELLARHHDVLSDEIKALDEFEKSPELMKASGLHLSEVRHMRADVQGQLAEVHSRAFAETPLHLAGLEELIPGAQWKGSHDQIAAAIESAKRAGVKIDAKPPHGDGHSWHVELEGRPLEIVERVDRHHGEPATHIDRPDSQRSGPPLGHTGERPGAPTKNLAAENRGDPYTDPRVEPDRPHQHLSDRELLPIRKMNIVTSWKKAAKALNKGPVAIGKSLKTAADGHALLAELATGNREALAKLGVTDIPENLDTSTREWALVQGRDGFAIYAGAHDSVTLPVDVRVLAHNHPAPLREGPHAGRVIDLPAGLNGKPFSEILADSELAGKAGITPSAKDIHTISDGGDHVIYTRYVHHGDGVITNPSGEGSRVNIHLSDTKVKLKNVNQGRYWYETTMTVRDSKGTPIWEGKVYTEWNAYGSNGRVQFTRPEVFDHPQQTGLEVVP